MRTTIDARDARLRSVTALALLATTGCLAKKSNERHFYDEHIQPIFDRSCTNATSPCHKVDPATGIALGNLDLTSFENVQKRRDVLRRYGTYPMPLLLLKAVPENSPITIPFRGRNLPDEIRHAGGKPLGHDSDAFRELDNWLKNGANIDGILPIEKGNRGVGSACRGALPPGTTLPTVDTNATAYTTFQSDILPFIANNCTYSTCHYSPQADFSLLCADSQDPNVQQFNFVQAASFVAPQGQAARASEILIRPLSSLKGGINHTGGVFFPNPQDPTWVKWEQWAMDVQGYVKAHPLSTETQSPGRQFFEANVMPKLISRGCAFEGCHSPNGFNDYRLRPGALGFLSDGALERNYEATINEFMALDTIDVKQSRAVKKTILSSSVGITHRGSAVLEDEGTTSDVPCPATFPSTTTGAKYDPTLPYDPANPNTARAFCVLQEWHRLERADRAASVSPMAVGDVLPLAFVSRPPNGDGLLQFDTYEGGADLKLADATLGADGVVMSVANVRSGLAPCAALAGKDVDVRGPEWSYDGTKVIFAARAGAASGLDLWELDVVGKTCKQLTTDAGRLVANTTVRVHNFDPVYAPDGSVVFASTRAGTLTQKNFLPNADLFRVMAPATSFANPQQMTFLLSSELAPAFMQDGRVSFTAEKATPDFYQLAGRRINWDLTDYHPLLAQRATSAKSSPATGVVDMDVHPSVGYQQATEIREGLDRNFLVVLSDEGSKGGGGALATFNRSVGPFQADRAEITFVKSMVIVDTAATARAGTKGVYRSPFSLPNGEILASYAANVTDPAMQVPKFDLVAVNDKTGARRALASDPTLSFVEGALGYKRAEKLLFSNGPQLVFGGFEGPANDQGEMHFPDLPLLATLLGANLRQGRDVDAFKAGAALKVYIDEPPPGPGAAVSGTQKVFSSRTPVGSAPLESDGSLRVLVPAGKPLILELVDRSGNSLFTMSEEHQVTRGEVITPGAPRGMFNAICAGCHGSISGQELDVAVRADALTGASLSVARDKQPSLLQ
ncbi:MAG: Periplasmic component of the Tol biopolymer transport system-like protein [Myxococcales bacterium]|nr:Periplasmic component of the Tol biopolymer transport system-like protein [Myxococcales bacterium]